MAVAPVMMFASSTDRQIEDAAKQSYNFRTILNGQVTVSSDDGVVTLTGDVASNDQRDLAEDTVKNLPGVVSVNDKIHVASDPAERSDGWIAIKIHSDLLLHSNVSATGTHVDVANGVVTLSGTVDTQAQKDLTEAYVKDIVGVKSVTNDLVVNNPNAATEPTVGEKIDEKMDDASITSQVKFELLDHRSTSALKTKVTTKDGVVIISGNADSDAEKDLVTKLASDIRGVRSVDNQMTVGMN
jgi:osmotically-inducible protein OsmY